MRRFVGRGATPVATAAALCMRVSQQRVYCLVGSRLCKVTNPRAAPQEANVTRTTTTTAPQATDGPTSKWQSVKAASRVLNRVTHTISAISNLLSQINTLLLLIAFFGAVYAAWQLQKDAARRVAEVEELRKKAVEWTRSTATTVMDTAVASKDAALQRGADVRETLSVSVGAASERTKERLASSHSAVKESFAGLKGTWFASKRCS